MSRLRWCYVLVALLATLNACGSRVGESQHAAQPGSDTAAGGRLTVFAAASLTGTFTEIAEQFERSHPGASITLNFASSSSLVAQINEGAPADVFASADPSSMAKLEASTDQPIQPQYFARNHLQIIVEAHNPKGIATIADLARTDVVVIGAGAEVPIGRYATQALENADVVVTPRSYEANVKAIVTKVVLGEADAGIVYATDVVAAGNAAMGIAIADDVNIVAEYPIAMTAAADDVALARSFIDFVLGPAGQQVLRNAGFTAP